MTDYEPVYAEPAEPRPRPRWERARPWLVAAIVAILITQITVAVVQRQADQDPSLEAPVGPAEQPVSPEDGALPDDG